jgi:hypothetical protein
MARANLLLPDKKAYAGSASAPDFTASYEPGSDFQSPAPPVSMLSSTSHSHSDRGGTTGSDLTPASETTPLSSSGCFLVEGLPRGGTDVPSRHRGIEVRDGWLLRGRQPTGEEPEVTQEK